MCGERRGRTKRLFALLRFVRVILAQGHANLPCIVPILTDDPRRESNELLLGKHKHLLWETHSRYVGEPIWSSAKAWPPCGAATRALTFVAKGRPTKHMIILRTRRANGSED